MFKKYGKDTTTGNQIFMDRFFLRTESQRTLCRVIVLGEISYDVKSRIKELFHLGHSSILMHKSSA